MASTLFDLTPRASAARRKVRSQKFAFIGVGIFFVALALILCLAAISTGSSPRAPSVLGGTGLFVGLGALCAGLGVAFPRFNRIPTAATIDRDGLKLRYETGEIRAWPWKDASSWFVLVDARETLKSKPHYPAPGPFYLSRVASSAVGLTEEAGQALVSGAVAAGIPVRSRETSLIRRRANLPAKLLTVEGSLYR